MIQLVAQRIAEKSPALEDWYETRIRSFPDPTPPVYGSVDIRNSGFKIAVVDTNLFPAGFNNLCETFSEKASAAFQRYFQKWYPGIRKILILPEEHTRNLFYWKNVAALKSILENAGLETQVGSASTLLASVPSVQKLFLEGRRVRTSHFDPDAILINNDLAGGTPDYLKELDQILVPSPELGWHLRRKSEHFHHLNLLTREVSQILDLDPWLLSPITTVETGINLSDEICLKRLQDSADRVLTQVREKYRQYGIPRNPYLFVKNNSGTYGFGIIHVDSGSQLLTLSRRLRNKLEFSKGGQKVSEYLLQEGIPTADFYRGKPLEPVVYWVGGEPIGTFFRIHEEKTERDSLNAPGMSFACLCYHKVEEPKRSYQLTYEHKEELFSVVSLLGKIASFAAKKEETSLSERVKIRRNPPSLNASHLAVI